MNIVTIFLGVSVGATTNGSVFLSGTTVGIIILGVIAFGCGTLGGVLLGKLMCKLTHGKGEPVDWFRRRVRGAYGRARIPEGQSGGEPFQLPAHARNGSERGRRNRLGSGGRRAALAVWLMN